jgi:AraC-like DNA-binding protein
MAVFQTLGLGPRQDGHVQRLRAPGRDRPVHRHAELELNLVIQGRAWYLVQGRRVDLVPDTLIWLFPGQDHILMGDGPDFAMWVGVFRPRLVRHVAREPESAPLRAHDPPGRHCHPLASDEARVLHALCAEAEAAQRDRDWQNATLGHLVARAWHATRHTARPEQSRELHPAVERAARRVRDSGGTASVDDASRACGLSRSRLSRLFRAQTGMTLPEYRNRIKLDRFFGAYGRGRRRTMADAAEEAGFGSYAQFHRAFKRHMGRGPADWHAAGGGGEG